MKKEGGKIRASSLKIIGIGELKGKDCFEEMLTEEEIKYCQSHRVNYPHFAGRLCAKEAVAETLGLDSSKVDLKEIEISNNSLGQPRINLHGKVKERAEKMKVKSFLISISHSGDYALANVIAL